MRDKLESLFFVIRGRYRITFGFCPYCNSDAPQLYSCPICENNRSPRKDWWKKFITLKVKLKK